MPQPALSCCDPEIHLARLAQAPAGFGAERGERRAFRRVPELSAGSADQFLNYRRLLLVRLSRKHSVNSHRTLNSFMNPFLRWSRLAWKTGEMAIASVPVIGHRTSRLLLAAAAPGARDRREFALMGHEKGAAMWESAQAVTLRLLLLNQQLAALAFRQMLSTSAALVSIAASRTPAESVLRQSKLVHDAMTVSVAAAPKLSGFAAQLARRGLVPVHARIRGNVRRLGKMSK